MLLPGSINVRPATGQPSILGPTSLSNGAVRNHPPAAAIVESYFFSILANSAHLKFPYASLHSALPPYKSAFSRHLPHCISTNKSTSFPPKKKEEEGKKRGRRRRMDIFNSDAIGDECFSPWWRAHAIADDVRRRSFLGGTTVSERETHNDRYVDECTASESENRPVIFLNLAYFKLFKHGIDTSLHPH